MVTPQSLGLMFGEFKNEDPQKVQMVITWATSMTNANIYGPGKVHMAMHLMVAHLLTMINRRGNGGSITSEQVGPMTTQYSAPNGDDITDLDSTSYGQMLKGLRRTVMRTPLLI